MKHNYRFACSHCKKVIPKNKPVLVDCNHFFCSKGCFQAHEKEVEEEYSIEGVAILGIN